jgi:hypothetical protein
MMEFRSLPFQHRPLFVQGPDKHHAVHLGIHPTFLEKLQHSTSTNRTFDSSRAQPSCRLGVGSLDAPYQACNLLVVVSSLFRRAVSHSYMYSWTGHSIRHHRRIEAGWSVPIARSMLYSSFQSSMQYLIRLRLGHSDRCGKWRWGCELACMDYVCSRDVYSHRLRRQNTRA